MYEKIRRLCPMKNGSDIFWRISIGEDFVKLFEELVLVGQNFFKSLFYNKTGAFFHILDLIL